MREEQNDYYLKRYEYAGFNRMEVSDIINYRDNTHVITDYRYDSFGRRIHTAERTKSGMRTIYDGLSFEVVKEAETFLGTRGITSSATGEANLTNYTPHSSDHTRGTRYYFIRDGGQELRTGKNGEALPDRTKGVRTYLYLNGERVAVNNLYNTNHGQYYYGSDILGSVKFVTGQGGQELKRIEYDVFGGIYKGNSPYGLETGYTGKPYDAVTGLSDYGFRDYSPAHARFMTEDPIRDGENWFAYVGNNPVNWVDPWGLEIIVGITTSDSLWGKNIGEHAFIMYINEENPKKSIMLDASGRYGGGRTADILDGYQAKISIDAYSKYFDTDEKLTTFELKLSLKEEKQIKDAIMEIEGYSWLQCARSASEVLHENYSKEIEKSHTPIGLMKTMLKFSKEHSEKVTIKNYDFKTNMEIKINDKKSEKKNN